MNLPVGRFAPSPTGPLHAGSLVAALGSWLDARARGGRWLVRIEDVDTPRCVPGAEAEILRQLDALGIRPDATPMRQSARGNAYAAALSHLRANGWAYDCGCTRRAIDEGAQAAGQPHVRFGERRYPGTCRPGLAGKPPRSVRVRTVQADGAPVVIDWHDAALGAQRQDLDAEVGDFVVQRADGLWAYQLAVVVDDAAQGITDVVRGADLADNTPRQIHLQRLLGLPTPRYRHLPLVLGADGSKLSKQNGAQALSLGDPLAALRAAGAVLGLVGADLDDARTVPRWLDAAVDAWRTRTAPDDRGGIIGS